MLSICSSSRRRTRNGARMRSAQDDRESDATVGALVRRRGPPVAATQIVDVGHATMHFRRPDAVIQAIQHLLAR